MKRLDLEEIILNYLYDKSCDEDELFDELEYLHHSIQKYCGYSKDEYQSFEDCFNYENKRYEFDEHFLPFVLEHFLSAQKLGYSTKRYLKITPTIKNQLSVWWNKLTSMQEEKIVL